MNPVRRRVLKRYLEDAMFRAMYEGLTVEDVLEAMTGAVQQLLRASRGERKALYRKELQIFYEEAASVLTATSSQIKKLGEVAKAMATDPVPRPR